MLSYETYFIQDKQLTSQTTSIFPILLSIPYLIHLTAHALCACVSSAAGKRSAGQEHGGGVEVKALLESRMLSHWLSHSCLNIRWAGCVCHAVGVRSEQWAAEFV